MDDDLGVTRAGVDDDLLRALGDEVLRVSGRRTTLPGSLLENSAFRILWRLEENGSLTLRELAEQLQLDQSTINRQVNSALKQGLVERVVVAGRSGNPVRATPSGRRAYEHDGRLRADVIGRAITDLGPERVRDMVDALRAFNDAVDRAEPPRADQPD